MDIDFTNTDSSATSGSTGAGLFAVDQGNPFNNANVNGQGMEWNFGNPGFGNGAGA